LREEFLALLGTHAPQDVVHMCGSGVTACHNLLAMERAGLLGSRLYAPSWSGWVSDSNRPVAKGAEAG
jgi:thiosulfate/3-mercaptopyruvate sulfurtransferase